jgi:hypothetical protein
MINEYHKGKIVFSDKIEKLKDSKSFGAFTDSLLCKNWVVYSKPPFASAEKVVEYLGRYTHRVAISNNRITEMKDGKITFSYRDYKDSSKRKFMTLDVFEFIHRFLLHILPDNFVKVRYYGILSTRNKKTKLRRCQQLFGIFKKKDNKIKRLGFEELLKLLKGIDYRKCPCCSNGKMTMVKEIEKKCYGPPLKN